MNDVNDDDDDDDDGDHDDEDEDEDEGEDDAVRDFNSLSMIRSAGVNCLQPYFLNPFLSSFQNLIIRSPPTPRSEWNCLLSLPGSFYRKYVDSLEQRTQSGRVQRSEMPSHETRNLQIGTWTSFIIQSSKRKTPRFLLH